MMRAAFAVFVLSVSVILADAPSPGRKYTTVQRLETAHLEAVHEARLQFARERQTVHTTGPYTDYRAVIHVHAEDAPHTKGTRPEVLAGAKEAGVQVVMSTDHRGPKPDAWTGMHDGVLFIAGSEDDHLLRFPSPGGDLRFLSHLEEQPGMSSEGFQGMEIYNRHTDANDEKAFYEYFSAALKDPREWAHLAANEARYPDEIFAAQQDYWPLLIDRWDKETATHTFTGIAANDAHKNQTYNGVTFDPYAVSFRFVSTHILARELTETAIRDALRQGRVYVAHDWLCDPTGFTFTAVNRAGSFEMGDHVPIAGKTELIARLPIAAHLKLIHNGRIVLDATGPSLTFTASHPGAYRLETWLPVDGEERPWIYSNSVFLQSPQTPH